MKTLRHIGPLMTPPLHPDTLYVLKGRHESFPLPVVELDNGMKLYDLDEVEAWYNARHIGETE